MEENIIKADDLEITDEDIEEMEKAMNFIKEQRKLCLRNYFDIKNYQDKALFDQPIEMIIFWAMARDCLVDMSNGKVYVLWRIKKLKLAPKLVSIEENEKGYAFNFKVYHQEGSKGHKWIAKEVFVPKKEYETFLKDYKDEIEFIKEKFSTFQC